MTDATQTTIRRMREAAGLSLRDLERLTGINRGRLSIIERGVVASQDETRAILAALTRPAVPDVTAVIGSEPESHV